MTGFVFEGSPSDPITGRRRKARRDPGSVTFRHVKPSPA